MKEKRRKAPTAQDCEQLHKKVQQASPLEARGPHSYGEFRRFGDSFVTQEEKEDEPDSMVERTQHIPDGLDDEVTGWHSQASQLLHDALLVVAPHVTLDRRWDPRSDLLQARLAASAFVTESLHTRMLSTV